MGDVNWGPERSFAGVQSFIDGNGSRLRDELSSASVKRRRGGRHAQDPAAIWLWVSVGQTLNVSIPPSNSLKSSSETGDGLLMSNT